MQITKEQLKQIIKEELEAILNEGPLGDAKAKVPKNSGNPFLDAFHTLEYLSGGKASLASWTANAEKHAREGNTQASKALDLVRGVMKQQSTMAEMRITTVSGHFPQGNLPPPKPEVPEEAKKLIFRKMLVKKQVPDGGTIEDADFWEVEEDFVGAVKVDGKYYYGEI